MIPGWSVTEINTVRAWYGQTPTQRLAKQLRRKPEEIDAAAITLGLRRPVVRELSETAKAVDRFLTEGVVEPKPKKALEPKPKPEPKPRRVPKFQHWTPAEEEALRQQYPFSGPAELAIRFGRPEYCVNQKAQHMGLKKDPEYLSAIARKRNVTRRNRLIDALHRAKDHLRRGDHLTALSLIDDAIGRVGVV